MTVLETTRQHLENPEIARKAAKWAAKYREDRTQPKAYHQKRIAEQLQGEFKLDRKVARQLAVYVTRDWA